MTSRLGERTVAPDLVRSARWLAAGTLGGFATGAVIGGVGGRVAMLVLRLTSSPSLHGLDTDDGFTIGIVSSATLFLIAFTGFLGMFGGIVYLAVRGWFPERWRPWVSGVVTGIAGGAVVIRPGGLDFRVLEPLPLAIAMFVAIPAAYGLALSLLVERLLRDDSILHRSRLWVLGLLVVAPISLLGPLGVAAVASIVLVWALRRALPALGSLWRSTAVAWTGRAALATFTAFELAELVRDVGEVL